MAEKIKKTFPWFVVLVLVLGIVAAGLVWQKSVRATDVGTSVTVANAAPSWVYVYEDPASDGTNPTNAGDNVTFKAKADDPNNDN